MPRPTITMSPQPPSAGEKITITYTGPCPAKLKVEIEPNGPVVDVAIDANGTGTYTVPDGVAIIISDPSGAAPAISSVINP